MLTRFKVFISSLEVFMRQVRRVIVKLIVGYLDGQSGMTLKALSPSDTEGQM